MLRLLMLRRWLGLTRVGRWAFWCR